MKHITLLLIVIVFVAVPGFAAKHDAASITLSTSVRVASFDLRAGDYRMTWVGSGPEVQVTFLRNGKIVATMPATRVDAHNEETIGQLENPSGVETKQEGNTTVLKEIMLPKINLLFVDTPKADQ